MPMKGDGGKTEGGTALSGRGPFYYGVREEVILDGDLPNRKTSRAKIITAGKELTIRKDKVPSDKSDRQKKNLTVPKVSGLTVTSP